MRIFTGRDNRINFRCDYHESYLEVYLVQFITSYYKFGFQFLRDYGKASKKEILASYEAYMYNLSMLSIYIQLNKYMYSTLQVTKLKKEIRQLL